MALALRTSRLLLREWCDEDFDAFVAMSIDPEVMRYLAPFPDRAAIDHWLVRTLAHWAEYGWGKFVVEIPGEAAFAGVVGLEHVGFDLPFTPAVEVLWRLARRYWGRGFAVEAARAAVEDGFYRLGLDEIVVFTVVENHRSRAVMERLSMRRESADDFDFVHPRLPRGHALRRHVLYRLKRA
jgi:ribosomal-protein-alanine N-acetyltransferase